MTIGVSRLIASVNPDGPHSTAWEYAEDPCSPVWPSPASTSAPYGWQAPATCRHPPRQSAASGARSYGQSESCTDAVSVTITPAPPAARRS